MKFLLSTALLIALFLSDANGLQCQEDDKDESVECDNDKWCYEVLEGAHYEHQESNRGCDTNSRYCTDDETFTVTEVMDGMRCGFQGQGATYSRFVCCCAFDDCNTGETVLEYAAGSSAVISASVISVFLAFGAFLLNQ